MGNESLEKKSSSDRKSLLKDKISPEIKSLPQKKSYVEKKSVPEIKLLAGRKIVRHRKPKAKGKSLPPERASLDEVFRLPVGLGMVLDLKLRDSNKSLLDIIS